MKKLAFILISVFALGITTANAQFKFGLKGGVNFSNVNGFNTTYIEAADNITRFHGGIMTEIKLPLLGIQGDLLYSAKGSTLTDAVDGTTSDFKSNYIDIPIVLKFYILKVLNLHAGPQFEFLLNAENDGLDVKDQFKSSQMSGVVGAGFELTFLYAALRYNFGLSKMGVENSPAFDSAKLNTFQASVGVWIGK